MKIIIILFITLLSFNSFAKTPSETIIECFSYTKKQDREKVYSCYTQSDQAILELHFKMLSAKIPSFAKGKTNEKKDDQITTVVDNFFSSLAIETLNEEINNDRATVTVKISFPEVISVVIRTILTEGINLNLSEEEKKIKTKRSIDKVFSELRKALDNPNTPMGFIEQKIKLIKENGEWKITFRPDKTAITPSSNKANTEVKTESKQKELYSDAPQKSVNTVKNFLNSLKNGDYQSAYDNFSSESKKELSFDGFIKKMRLDDDKIKNSWGKARFNPSYTGTSDSNNITAVFKISRPDLNDESNIIKSLYEFGLTKEGEEFKIIFSKIKKKD